jgi:hypothetical protein
VGWSARMATSIRTRRELSGASSQWITRTSRGIGSFVQMALRRWECHNSSGFVTREWRCAVAALISLRGERDGTSTVRPNGEAGVVPAGRDACDRGAQRHVAVMNTQ